jgi:hypothetical protein
MTTMVEQDIQLEWDAFLDKTAPQAAQARAGIASFREMEWPAIKRELASVYGLAVPDGLEPHWVEPGRAVYWQHQLRTERAFNEKMQKWERVEKDYGWQPTSGLPASNPSIMAHYLKKGLRLRPPQDGVDEEAFKAAGLSLDVSVEQAMPERTYKCVRHPGDNFSFPTWKAYIAHCLHRREVPEEEPPEEVREKMGTFEYYCALHDKGFNNRRLADRHVRNEQRRPSNAGHPPVDSLRVVIKEESHG